MSQSRISPEGLSCRPASDFKYVEQARNTREILLSVILLNYLKM